MEYKWIMPILEETELDLYKCVWWMEYTPLISASVLLIRLWS